MTASCIINPNWHGGDIFYFLVPLGSDFVGWILIKNFQTFLEVKIDINWINLTSCQAHWVLYKIHLGGILLAFMPIRVNKIERDFAPWLQHLLYSWILWMDHIFHTGTIKTVPQKMFVPIFTQELFRVTIYERVTFLQDIVCLFSHRNYKNSSSG